MVQPIEVMKNGVWKVYSPELGRVIQLRRQDNLSEEELMKRYMAHSNTMAGGAKRRRDMFRDK